MWASKALQKQIYKSPLDYKIVIILTSVNIKDFIFKVILWGGQKR